jgi:hypothetical protein
VSFFLEVSFFGLNALRGVKKIFLQLFTSDLNYLDNVKLFSSISHDYAMIFKSKFKNTEVFLLDDGFGVFSNIDYFSNYKFYIRLRYFLLSILTFSIITNPFNFIYFSEFNLNGVDDRFRIKYEKKKIKLEKLLEIEKMIILGTSEVELGLIELNYFLNLLSSIKDKYRECEYYYYPHRKESVNKLKLIEELGIYIQYSETPFEYYLTNTAKIPKNVVGFTSSNSVYEILTKFNCNLNVILVDNLSNSYKMPELVKKYILSSYNDFYNIKSNFSK